MSIMRLRRSRLRSWIKKVPRQRHVRGTWLHRLLGDRLFASGLWRPSGNKVAAGVATGLFWAMMPIPFQMLPAGITAYLLRFNIPAAITSVWITNPVTWPLILYWQYRLGAWLLGQQAPSDEEASLLASISGVPIPLLLGCVITGVALGTISYIGVAAFWRWLATRWWRSHEDPRRAAQA
jgi:uncharacterized protein (DUF2062 family)